MKHLCLLIIISFVYITVFAQEANKQVKIIYGCDTTDDIFFKKIQSNIDQIKDKNNKSFFNLYEGETGYAPSYSFTYWEDKKGVHNRAIVACGYDYTRHFYNQLDSIFLINVDIDSLIQSINHIVNYQIDTNIISSHDHLLAFKILTQKKFRTFKFCESQFLRYPNDKQVMYLIKLLNYIHEVVFQQIEPCN
jgi:hypothetical protein